MQDFKHQHDVFERFKDQAYGALFLEQGLGKTRIAIQLAEHNFAQGNITACVVVTTKGLVGNWLHTEIPKHSSIEYNTYAWNVPKQFLLKSKRLLYFLVNIDGLLANAFPETFKEFLRMHPKFMVIIDESTVVKNPKAARTKRCLQLAGRSVRRFIMSGTPVTNSPLDLFSQCEMLVPQCLGHKSIVTFRSRYAITERRTFGPRSFDVIVGYRLLDELTGRVQKFASILKKADCLDLPEKMYRTIDVEMTGEQINAYMELKEKALTYIQDHEITVVNAISLINRLLQICAGQIKVGDKYLSLPNNRLAMTKELVEECPGKTIIWTSFVNTATDLVETLGKSCIHLPSGTSLEKRHQILEEFRKGTPKALIANPASAGHGITLTESSNVIYYSNSWNYEHRAQSEDRAHRIGQTESVLYTDLIAPDTVEQKIVDLLKAKKVMADTVITSAELRSLLT
jgi:SNF2 family DNA or RNA helicase